MKASKLYERLLQSPHRAISFRDFERLLHAFGFRLLRTRGSHRSYVHPEVTRPMVVQPRGSEAKPYQVREFLDMVEEHGLSLID